MGKKILAGLVLGCFLFGGVTASLLAREKNDPGRAKIAELREQISLLNLVNGLYLTRAQIKEILPKINAALKIKEEAETEYKKVQPDAEKAFQALKKELEQNQDASPEIKKWAGGLNENIKKKVENTAERMAVFENEIESILTEKQRYLASEFIPCLLPRATTTNPVRIGQAKGDTAEAEKLLTRLRELPLDRYEENKSKVAERIIDKYEEKVSLLGPEEKEIFREETLKLFSQARSLPEVDFQVQKQELAKQITPDTHRKETGRRKGQLGKVGRYFLNENMAQILKNRLNLL
ncbi:MAG: hypothetical protein ABIK20_01940 [Candidatus Omnitrophota bacterium]